MSAPSKDRMRPEPDHGEEAYRGTGRLEGRRALVTGGDSGIGKAVAIAFAREGADVAIGYLDEHDDAVCPLRRANLRNAEKRARQLARLPSGGRGERAGQKQQTEQAKDDGHKRGGWGGPRGSRGGPIGREGCHPGCSGRR